MSTPFSYSEVGSTDDGATVPEGYNVLRYRTRLRRGVLDVAAEKLMTFGMHRSVGIRIQSSADRAAPGVRVTSVVGVGPIALHAPCQVISVIDEPHRRGFTYGTVAGSPLQGEERFLLEEDTNGDVWFSILAFSLPARWYTRAAGPLLVGIQRLFAQRCGAVMRRSA